MRSPDRTRRALLLAILGLGLGCGDPALERAVDSYRESRDYDSLRFIEQHLAYGMPRSRVRELLGPPATPQVGGEDYYPSFRSTEAEGEPVQAPGLAVGYADPSGKYTTTLRSHRWEPARSTD